MPRIIELDRHTPSELLRGHGPQIVSWWGAPIDHPANYLNRPDNFGGKLRVALGVDAANIDAVGEVFYIVQPEGDPRKIAAEKDPAAVMKEAQLRRSKLDSMIRMAGHTRVSTARSRQRTTSQSVYLQRFHRDVLGQPPLHGDPLRLSTIKLAGTRHVHDLATSRTVHRREVRDGLTTNTMEVRDGRSRPNPGATAARLARLSDELLRQIVFDRGSARSLEQLGQVAVDAFADDFDVATQALEIAEQRDDAALEVELPGILEFLCAKPLGFAASYIDWSGFSHLRGESLYRRIRFVVEAEFQLISTDEVLSRLKDDLQLIDDAVLDPLSQSLQPLVNFADGYYSALASLLQTQLESLLGYRFGDPNKLRKRRPLIDKMKREIRYRYQLPQKDKADGPWTLRQARDSDGAEIWVAQSRFGHSASVSSISRSRRRFR